MTATAGVRRFVRFAPMLGVLTAVLGSGSAQVPPATSLVLTATAAGTAQLVGVAANGAIAAFGPFPSDVLPPQAVEVDPIDRHALVAVDLGNGTSRVLRLLPGVGTAFAGELPLADLPGPCAQLTVTGDWLLAVVGGSNGGVYRLPRRGGPAVRTVVRPDAAALHWFGFGDVVILAWSGATVPPTAPGLEVVDTATGQVQSGPFAFGNRVGARPTGLIDLPTALSRQVIAFADGSYWLHTVGLGDPVVIPTSPPLPPGGAVAFRQDAFGFSGIGLGPFLYRADSTGAITALSAALPGQPVDFAVPRPAVPQVLAFGTACGAPQLQLVNGVMGPPQLGNSSFDLRVLGAVPQQPVFLLWGFDDVLGGVLPAPVLGCNLQVDPANLDIVIANAGGLGRRNLPIPNVPALAGAIAFAQWALPVGGGVAASPAMAIQLWF